MTRSHVLVLPGDGIGPEVVGAAMRVLAAVNQDIEYEQRPIGLAALDAFGRPYSDDLIDIARKADAVLLGAVGGVQDTSVEWELRPEAALFDLRTGLGLYANIRPVRSFDSLIDRSALRPDQAAGVDMLIVRELIGGAYFGAKGQRDDGVVFDTFEYTASEVSRVVRRAFGLARTRRRKVTSVDKANILRTSVMWRGVTEGIALEHPDIECDHLLVDNAALQLLLRPASFDVIVTENLFGDILSDEAAGIVGGLGMLPSASLGDDGPGLFEPVHGSAPDLAGSGWANPTGAILSAALLMRHAIGDEAGANAVEAAVARAFADGVRTRDIGGSDDMDAFVTAVLRHL